MSKSMYIPTLAVIKFKFHVQLVCKYRRLGHIFSLKGCYNRIL